MIRNKACSTTTRYFPNTAPCRPMDGSGGFFSGVQYGSEFFNFLYIRKTETSYKFCFMVAALLIWGGATGAIAAGNRFINIDNTDAIIKKLEEKGVLSKQDVKEINEETKKARQEHSLNLSTRLQMLYTYKSHENHSGKVDQNDFNIRRMRFQMDGNMYKNIGYKFEFSADRMSDVAMKDAWVDFRHIPMARLRVGQFKTPFSRQRIISSSKLQMVERSPVQLLYPGRDTGLELSGKNIGGMVDYAVAVLTGWGDRHKFIKTDNSNLWGDGRIAFHPLGEIPLSEGDIAYTRDLRAELAVNFLYAGKQVAFGEKSSDDMFNTEEVFHKPGLSGVPIGDTFNIGPELTIVFKGLSLAVESYWAQFNPIAKKYRTIMSQGYFLQAGAFIIPETLEITARFEKLDIDTEHGDDPEDLKAFSIGCNYFVFEKHDFKVQANYTREERDHKLDMNSDTVMLNMQVKY